MFVVAGCWIVSVGRSDSMTESEWLGCTDPPVMERFLRNRTSQRKTRLFFCGKHTHTRSGERRRVGDQGREGRPGEASNRKWSAGCRSVGSSGVGNRGRNRQSGRRRRRPRRGSNGRGLGTGRRLGCGHQIRLTPGSVETGQIEEHHLGVHGPSLVHTIRSGGSWQGGAMK
jgi:hypothetical protein